MSIEAPAAPDFDNLYSSDSTPLDLGSEGASLPQDDNFLSALVVQSEVTQLDRLPDPTDADNCTDISVCFFCTIGGGKCD